MPDNPSTDKLPHKNLVYIHDSSTQMFRGLQDSDFGDINANIESLVVSQDDVERLLTGISGDVSNLNDLTQSTGDASVNFGILNFAIAQTGQAGSVNEHGVVAPWFDELGRQIIKGYNTSENALDVLEQSPALTDTSGPFSETGLTEPGFTSQQNILNYELITYQTTISSIDTNVVLEIEQSNDASNWFTSRLENTAVTGMSIANNQVTVTENGTFGLTTRRQGQWSRLQFVSESGGTSATVSANFLAGR